MGGTGKDLSHHIGKKFKRFAFINRVKTGLIPALTKCGAITEIEMTLKRVALVRSSPELMPIIHHLEITVLLHNPSALFAHKWAQDLGGIFIVIVGRTNVTNIMQQS